ncbi:MAG: recombinase family protein [Firmicutes bacterium]|nr:recombinase family protein [Bacillota bacterium]
MSNESTEKKAYFGSPEYSGRITISEVLVPSEHKVVYGRKLRVTAYIRVSTDSLEQEGSLKLQREYFEALIRANPNWEYVEIYEDDGISATSVDKRKGFLRMIEDAKAGKIDLILTKSISRFARNLGDLLHYANLLNNLSPPVEVQFETDRASTFGSSGQLMLTLLGLFAQEESRKKSEAINWAIDNMFAQGKFYVHPAPLGFIKEKGRDKPLVVHEEDAKTVKLCYAMTAEGYSFEDIAGTLNMLGRRRKLGNVKWTASGVMSLLMNEKYRGDLRARKTVTRDYLSQRSIKNEIIVDGVKKSYKPQYYVTEHHEPIVPHLAFDVALRIIKNRVKRNDGGLPCLKAIPNGVFKGFITINKKVKGYSLGDYVEASKMVDEHDEEEIYITADKAGVFDLRTYETVSTLLFDEEKNRISCTIKDSAITFNAACRHSLNSNEVEVLFHPQKALVAIRQVTDKADSIAIAARNGVSKKVALSSFLPVALESAGLKEAFKYRIYGTQRVRNGENIILFDLSDAQIVPDKKGSNEVSFILPSRYAQSYGKEYYSNLVSSGLHRVDVDDLWQALQESKVYDPLAGQVLELKEFCNEVMNEFGIGGVTNE